jgi:hypothetical protein
VRVPAAIPQNTDAWERLLVLHYLRTDGPFGTAPLRWIDATPIELARATRIEGFDPEVAKSSFLSTFTNEYVTRDVFRGGRVPKPASVETPGYFRYLILSALVPALAPEETNSKDFRVRLGALMGLGGPLSDVGGLPRLWQSLAKWCDGLRADARPFRRVVLPERGHMRIIGYSIRLAFPSWRDRERLTQEVDRVGAERFDRPRAAIDHLKHPIEFGTHSTSMKDAFADFYTRFQNGERLLTQHRFWRLIRDVVSTLENRSRIAPVSDRARLTLSFGIDDADMSMAFVVASGTETDPTEVFHIEGTVPTVLEDLMSSPVATRWVPDWVRQTITSGVLLLGEERWGRWALKKRSEIGRADVIAVVRDHIAARPNLRSIEWRPAGRGWVFGDIRNLGELERLFLGLDRQSLLLDEDLATLKVVGGIKTGDVLLGRPRTLPSIRATAASSLSIEAIGDTRGDPSLEPLGGDTWSLVARTPIAGTWRIIASEDAAPGLGHMEVEQNIAFDDRAVEHALLADPDRDPARFEVEVELVAARGAALEWRSVASPAAATGMDDRLTDLLEAIYARGRAGWAESDIVDLMRRVIGPSEGPRPWDMLRILHVSGWIVPRQMTTWRGRRWFLRPLSLVVIGEGASAVTVLDGASPLVVRERFRAVAASVHSNDVAGVPIGVWSPPVLAVQGADPAALGEALGLSVEREFDVALSPAPSAWPKESRSTTHRELVSSWSWHAGAFRTEAGESPHGVSLSRYRRARGDDRDVYIVGAPGRAPMSFTSRDSAVMEAHRSAGSPLFELTGSRLRRMAADGHLPEPVGRKLRLTHLINPGVLVDPIGRRSFAYPGDRHDVEVLHGWFGAAIDAPMPRDREDGLSAIGRARHRSPTPRLAWRGGIVDPRTIRSATGRGG